MWGAWSAPQSSEALVGQRWRLTKKIGSGSFGDIFLGVDVRTGEEKAVKLEPVSSADQQLHHEAHVLRQLAGGAGMPTIHWAGKEGDANAMVEDLLGSSLMDLFNRCGHRFSLKTVLMIGDQMFTRLEYVHSKNFLHRDVKPENIVMGAKHDADKCYLIDFGLSKQYIDPSTNRHIPNKTGKKLTGTARYASIDTHRGLQQGRKDDLESLMYVLIGFLRGKLPWQGLEWSLMNRKKPRRYSKVGAKKQAVSAQELCNGLPVQFCTLLTYCRSLKFDEKPNYNYCRKLLREAFDVQGYSFDYAYDWKVGRGAIEPSRAPQTFLPQQPSMLSAHAPFGHQQMAPVPFMQHGQFYGQPIMGF